MTSATLPILSWPITDKIKLAALGLLGIWIALMANITIIMKGPVQPDTGDAPTDVRAFPSCEGFGCNTLGGRQAGSSVCIITNTNSSGTGSASACFLQSGPRFIISKVSGVVLLNETTLTAANSNVHFFGQTAPGDGLMFQPSGQNRAFNFGGRGSASSAFQDAVFQHFRIRNSPGTGGTSSNAGQDAFNLRKGVHNVIFDHCEIMWTSDEAFNFYHHDDFSIGEGNDTYNLTISRCIIGEGGLAQNYGPLHTSRPGEFQYNISQHHNLIIHTEKRNPKWASATASSTSNNRGIEWVNNVHYNWFSEGVQLQTGVPFWTGGHPLRMDITNNYFRNGPGKNVAVIRLTVFDPTTCASWPNAW